MERLDIERAKWVSVEYMQSRRSTLGVAVLNDQLFAVGGFDGTNGLETVEKYNPGERLCVRNSRGRSRSNMQKPVPRGAKWH